MKTCNIGKNIHTDCCSDLLSKYREIERQIDVINSSIDIINQEGEIVVEGPQGPKGDKGDTGNTGPQGPQGIPGVGGGATVSPFTSVLSFTSDKIFNAYTQTGPITFSLGSGNINGTVINAKITATTDPIYIPDSWIVINGLQKNKVNYVSFYYRENNEILVFTDVVNPDTSGSIVSISGTNNRIDVTNTNGSSVINISPNYVGQSSINTLGAISIGSWNATPIANNYLQNNSINTSIVNSGTDFGVNSSSVALGGSLIISAPDASLSARGLLNTSTQTLPSYKNFSYTTNQGKIPSASLLSITGNNTQTITNNGAALLINPLLRGNNSSSTIYGLYVNPSFDGNSSSVLTVASVSGTGLANGTFTVTTTTSGSGSSAQLIVVVSGNAISSISVYDGGSGYSTGNTLTFSLSNTTSGVQSFTTTVLSLGGSYAKYSLGVGGDAIISNTLTCPTINSATIINARVLNNIAGNNLIIGQNTSFGTFCFAADNEFTLQPGTTVSNAARFQIGGIAYGTLGFSRGETNMPVLRPSMSNDVLIGLDVAPTYESGSTAIANYSYTTTGNATGSGTSFVTFSGGTGSGFRLFISTTLGSSTISISSAYRGGTGYTNGDALTATYNGVTINVTATTVGLSNITSYSARFNGQINLNYTPNTATSNYSTLVRDNTTGDLKQITPGSITQSANTPTLSDVQSNTFKVWKNTTSGELRIYANDNGTLKSILFS